MREKLEFPSGGAILSAALERPESAPRAYAVFAHCFTCGKDIAAASRISRALSEDGIGVLRFDFTGLGNSDGDFSNTNFSSNVDDLVAAAEFLADTREAPLLLIGHSLGGAAVLMAARHIPSVKAVVTLGAPFRAEHVSHLFSGAMAEIDDRGEAEVQLGQRQFTIRRQFLDDLQSHEPETLERLQAALLVMHSPLDDTVPIGEAEKIYRHAKHPKSFVSLHEADHLLTKRDDADYAARTIAAWSDRYLPKASEGPSRGIEKGQVLVVEKDHRLALHVYSDSHHWLADEPTALGGANSGPDPYEHLLAALGACSTMTMRMYAERKGLALRHVEVTLSHDRNHAADCADCEGGVKKLEVLRRRIRIEGDLADADFDRLLEIADRCPVHRTLTGELEITTIADG